MTPERYQQVKSAFRLALEFPPGQRDTLLHQLCGGDDELRIEVQDLLDNDALPSTPLDRPAVGTQFRLRAMSLSHTATRQ
ncbi:MAG: hypothetical protein HYX27_22725 [Acidobacteria bacterium]|nr:hypothetical protein [Acidobacteriota bacterium]